MHQGLVDGPAAPENGIFNGRGVFSKRAITNAVTQNLLDLTFVILLWLYVEDIIDASFTTIFIPLYITSFFNFLIHANVLFIELARYPSIPVVPRLILLFVSWPMFLLTLILLALRLSDSISTSYIVCMIPLFLCCLLRPPAIHYATIGIGLEAKSELKQYETGIGNSFVVFSILGLFVTLKADEILNSSWGAALWIYWIMASVLLCTGCFSCCGSLIFAIARNDIIPDGWIPWADEGLMVNGSRLQKLVQAFLLWLFIFGFSMFFFMLFLTIYLDSSSDLSTSSFFIPLILMYSSSALFFYKLLRHLTSGDLFMRIEIAIQQGIPGANVHPSQGKCPMCRAHIRAIAQMDDTNHIIQKRGEDGDMNPDVGVLVRQTSTLYKSIARRRSSSREIQVEIDPENINEYRRALNDGDDMSVKDCYVCTMNPGDTVFLDCGHSGVCWNCAIQVFEGLKVAPMEEV